MTEFKREPLVFDPDDEPPVIGPDDDAPAKPRQRKKPKPRTASGKKDRETNGGKYQRGPKPPRPLAASPANSATSPREAEHRMKIAEALEYRRQGHAYHVIGAQMGISAPYAYELVAEGLHLIVAEPARALFKIEMERLNEMMASVYPNAVSGDIKAIETVLHIMERIDRLHGLEHPRDLAHVRGDTVVQNSIEIHFVSPNGRNGHGGDDDGDGGE